jgi:hypothetical protein
MTTKLLTQAQAEAVYSAMCALNNVGGKVKAEFDNPKGYHTAVFENAFKYVTVVESYFHRKTNEEAYTSQAAFAEAYGLN